MLSPLPRRSGWAYCFAHSPSRISLPRKGCRVGLRIVLFEACSAFTRVTACTLALSPIRDTLTEGFSHFVSSMTAPVASGWSGCRVGLAPTGKAPPFHGAHPSRTLGVSQSSRVLLLLAWKVRDTYSFGRLSCAGRESFCGRRDENCEILHKARLNSFGTFHCFSFRPHRSYQQRGVRR